MFKDTSVLGEVFIILVMIVAIMCFGIGVGIKLERNNAIQHGSAHYSINEKTGEAVFVYNTSPTNKE